MLDAIDLLGELNQARTSADSQARQLINIRSRDKQTITRRNGGGIACRLNLPQLAGPKIFGPSIWVAETSNFPVEFLLDLSA